MNQPSHTASQLVQKYSVSVALVESMIEEETQAILQQARVTAFVPIFVTRRVEDKLRRLSQPSDFTHRQAA